MRCLECAIQKRVRYDRLVRGGYDLGWYTNRGATDHAVPCRRIMPLLYQAFHAGYPRFVPLGREANSSRRDGSASNEFATSTPRLGHAASRIRRGKRGEW